ncbi:uncharacterized protein LOC122853817 [Aphidius gifuensis]|uniref:uncharacterized protein LOC122853817 n=1 Tax=Aphidius gifuensis TaxID=684658 RepID=UPI001CDCB4A3|nr:uncharacterized protein LOC122853817 [Aphidius gifuensis]
MELSSLKTNDDSNQIGNNNNNNCSNDSININSISNIKETRLHVKRTQIRFLIDSGSVVSVIPRSTIKCNNIAGDFTLFAANQTVIQTYGDHIINVDFGLRRPFKWSFTVADIKTPIIGADFLTHYNLLIDLKKQKLIDAETQFSAHGVAKKTTEFGITTISSLNNAIVDINNLLEEYIDITISPVKREASVNSSVAHHIETTGQPASDRPRRISGEKLTAAIAEF